MPVDDLRVDSPMTHGVGGTARMTHRAVESYRLAEVRGKQIKELGDWRGEMLGRLRALVKQADPDVVEVTLNKSKAKS